MRGAGFAPSVVLRLQRCGRRKRLPHIALLLSLPAVLAAADGVVTNQTTGKPQANAAVSLLQMTQQGPQPIENTHTGADGRFALTKPIPPGGMGPLLVQVTYQGVQYNKVIPPGQPTTGLDIPIYDATRTPGPARVDQHMIVLEPANDGQLHVNEAWIFRNEGKTTWNDSENGTLRFELPEASGGKVNVSLLAPGGMPIQRPAQPAGKPNQFKVDFPIRPGESQVQMEWAMPFSNPGTYATHILTKGGVTRLVAPPGISIKGEGVDQLGQEPRTQAMIFGVKTDDIKVEISGTGAFQRDNQGGDQQQNDGSGSLSENLPKIYGLLLGNSSMGQSVLAVKWLLLSIFGMLGIAFAILYRRGNPGASSDNLASKADKNGRGRG
jgi:hypothetical protein